MNDHEVLYDPVGTRRNAVLCMHGGGLHHASFRPWLDSLADLQTLVYYDQFGLGRSERPIDYGVITNSTRVDETEALGAHLGYGTVVVLRHSYGGYLNLEYALKYPDRVRGLILASTAAALDYARELLAATERRSAVDQLVAVHQLSHHPDAIVTDAASATQTDDDLRELLRRVLPVHSQSFALADQQHFLATSDFSAKGHDHQLHNLISTYDVSATLGEITIPTLVIVGRHDIVTPPAASVRIHRRIAGSELMVLEDSGHFPFAEENIECLHVVRHWLTALARSSGN